MKTTCRINGTSFNLNGRDTFLHSGEVHYFRIPPRYWERHLAALVDANCNAVSTYVPWSWHEAREGRMDFTGKTHPGRDLLGFLDLAREHDLHVTLKPGPYVMAEITDQGIPAWMTRDYPETRALDEDGTPWGADYICYASPVFRRKAARWLRAFARKAVLPRQGEKAGAVILLQLCNEIGMFQWLRGSGDYSPASLAGWWRFLRRTYPDVGKLARLLGRDLKRHREVRPPQSRCEDPATFVLYRLWHDYYRWLYGDYVAFLAGLLKAAGVEVPFFTNVGGWVFGRAHEFPLNGSFHCETRKVEPQLIYGLDHIPEFVSPLNVHDAVVANQTARELQKGRGPLYSAELQCGSREHGVQPYPQELGLFYRLCIIHGLTGMNYYMFSQGRNPRGRGMDGPMFYWYNALDFRGRRQPVYPVIRELGEWLKTNGGKLLRMKRPATLAVGLDTDLYETEFLTPVLHKQSRLDAPGVGLSIDPVGFRDRALFDGVIRLLTQKSVPFDLADLHARPVRGLLHYDTLVVLCADIMDAVLQNKLVAYVRAGGKLTLFPMMPRFDRVLGECRILERAIGIREVGRSSFNRVYTDSLRDIPVEGSPMRLAARGARVLARDSRGHPVGLQKRVGKGTVRFFGFHFPYRIEEHPSLWEEMMGLGRATRHATVDSDMMHAEVRTGGGEGVLFAGNFHRMPVSASLRVRDPRGEGTIDIGRMTLSGLTGLMLPIRARLAPGLELVYAHGELLERKATSRGARFRVRGPVHSHGCLALKSRTRIGGITIDGEPVRVEPSSGLYRLDYPQTGSAQQVEVSYSQSALRNTPAVDVDAG